MLVSRGKTAEESRREGKHVPSGEGGSRDLPNDISCVVKEVVEALRRWKVSGKGRETDEIFIFRNSVTTTCSGLRKRR